ncbi:TetR/AcrR family transcriptional regulator [Nocardia australiensis]|uniref:TetR/AcrR family transcriptional regulator n=1 Tax=Nocardia australiensis TaxID=2887191 RepID=UPI001D157A4D|nr:TetR/AcrR family transcriptional regulator [Nocardia australiensis]
MNTGKRTTKDRLLEAARQCLLRRGYARTSVRDLVAASGVNQASINYHFGSKEALLNLALFQLNGDWGDMMFGAIADASIASPVERWRRVIDSVRANPDLWSVNFESVALAAGNEEIRSALADRGHKARIGLARAFAGLEEGRDSDAAIHAAGSHYYSLLIGVALQWLTDPATAPSAEEIVDPEPQRRAAVSERE